MHIQAKIEVVKHAHIMDAIIVYWRSRGFELLNSSEKEAVFVRGNKGYKWISVNPFKYYMGLKCTVVSENARSVISCEAEIERNVTKNIWRDLLVREEFLQLEAYLNGMAEGKPFLLTDVRTFRFKPVWPVYVLNLILPGWGLLYTGTFAGAYLGLCWFIINLIMGINIYLNQPIHFSNFYEVQAGVLLLLWLIGSVLGTMIIVRKNYERVLKI